MRNGKKSNKQKAYEEWLKLTDEERAKLIPAIKAQVAHYNECKKSGEFVAEFPDCFRWIQKRQWEDEIAITQKKGVFVSTKPDIPGMFRLAEQKKLQLGLSDEEK